MEQDGAVQHLDPSPLCFLSQGALRLHLQGLAASVIFVQLLRFLLPALTCSSLLEEAIPGPTGYHTR